MTTFFPTVVETLGYGRIKTLLLTAPPYVIAVIVCLANAWHADRTQERYLHIAGPPLIAMVMCTYERARLSRSLMNTLDHSLPKMVLENDNINTNETPDIIAVATTAIGPRYLSVFKTV